MILLFLFEKTTMILSVLSSFALVSGLMVVRAKNLVHSVLFVMSEFASGVKGIALNLENESVGILLVIVGLIIVVVVGWVLSTMDPLGTKGKEVFHTAGGASSSSENPEDEESRRERKRRKTEQQGLRDLKTLLVRFCYRYGCNGKRTDVCGPYCPSGKSESELTALVEQLADFSLHLKRGDPAERWNTLSQYSKFMNDYYPADMTKHRFYHIVNR
jgi:hypothetical protein